jgi:hypothetical protein
MTNNRPDFELRYQGTISILYPLCREPAESAPAKVSNCPCGPCSWISEHSPEDVQTWGGGIVIEHRYVENWLTQAILAGFSIQTYEKNGAKGQFLEGK